MKVCRLAKEHLAGFPVAVRMGTLQRALLFLELDLHPVDAEFELEPLGCCDNV